MPQHLSTLLIWTFYWQEFDRKEWEVKRYGTRNFTLIEWSARRRKLWWWRYFKGHQYNSQKEDDAAPPVALWDSCFYKSWKVYKAMVHPLAGNQKYLLVIFQKFSSWWWKCSQLRSWISFGKRYHGSSYLNHRSWIKGKSVSIINKGGGVNTQQ